MLLCQLESTEGEDLGNIVVLGSYAYIWVGLADRSTDFSRHDLHVVLIAPMYSFELSQTTYTWCHIYQGVHDAFHGINLPLNVLSSHFKLPLPLLQT